MNSLKTIMIIDDDSDYVDATRRILENASYRVETARSSDEAMKKMGKIIPDLIILDIMMQKGAEGHLLSRRFKSVSKTSRIPILVITSITEQTGHRWLDDPRHPLFFPVDEIMEKPVPAHKLLSKIEETLATKTKG